MSGRTATGLRTAAATSGIAATGHALRTTELHGVLRVGFMKVPTGATTKVDGGHVSSMDRRLLRTGITDLQAMRTDTTRITTIMENITKN